MQTFVERVRNELKDSLGRIVELHLPGGKIQGRLRDILDQTGIVRCLGGEINVDLNAVYAVRIRSSEEEDFED